MLVIEHFGRADAAFPSVPMPTVVIAECNDVVAFEVEGRDY